MNARRTRSENLASERGTHDGWICWTCGKHFKMEHLLISICSSTQTTNVGNRVSMMVSCLKGPKEFLAVIQLIQTKRQRRVSLNGTRQKTPFRTLKATDTLYPSGCSNNLGRSWSYLSVKTQRILTECIKNLCHSQQVLSEAGYRLSARSEISRSCRGRSCASSRFDTHR